MPRKQISLGSSSPLGAAPTRKTVKRARKTANGHEPVVAAEPVTETQAQMGQTLPSREDIASLAYFYWEARGCQGGSPEDDWIRAERELMGQAQRSERA